MSSSFPSFDHPLVPDRRLTRAERGRLTATTLRLAAEADPDSVQQHELHDRVVVLNLPVAEAVALRYRNRGIDQDDLQQVACEGLVKAVARFDVGRELDFLTFAVPTIRGEVMRYFRDCGWMVRPPRRIQERQRAVNHATQELAVQWGRTPEPAEVSAHLGLTRAEYDEAAAAVGAFAPTSLDATVGHDGHCTLGDLVADDADGTSAAAEARAVIQPLLRRLSERDRQILLLRYRDDLTQREIGQVFGVTQMQVSRLLSRIHGRLRAQLDEVV